MFRVIQEEIGIDKYELTETRMLNSDLRTPPQRTPPLSPPSVKHRDRNSKEQSRDRHERADREHHRYDSH